MTRYILLVLALVIAGCGLAPTNLRADTEEPFPVFPGAEGFGTTTPGGRGGRVIEVTNLNDQGSGSLRACAQASGPRICVFRVAGTIQVNSRIDIWNPYLTIAGQTAPGGGITLKNGPANRQAPMAVLAHDVVIRHLRFRPGPSSEPSGTVDSLTIVHQKDDEHPAAAVYNVVIDHVSFSWATDEVVNTASDSHDITIQWSIIAEGLHCSNHPQGCMSKGMLLGAAGSKNISVHHNLFAHNKGRNPLIKTGGIVDVVNNVMFIPAQIAAAVDGEHHGTGDVNGPVPVNFDGNYVIAPYGDGLVYGVQLLSKDISLYVKGNIGPYRTDDDQSELLFVDPKKDGHSFVTEARHTAPFITTTSAFEARDQVLTGAGATQGLDSQGNFFWRQDPVDERIMTDVKAGTTRLIDDPAEVGGWPELDPGTPYEDTDHDGMADVWETAHFDNLERGSAADSSSDFDGDGYTDLEEFLNGTDPNVRDR